MLKKKFTILKPNMKKKGKLNIKLQIPTQKIEKEQHNKHIESKREKIIKEYKIYKYNLKNIFKITKKYMNKLNSHFKKLGGKR